MKRKTRKKQQDIIQKRKKYLTEIICGIILVVLCTILTFVCLYQYNQKPITYEDIEYKEFTFESFEVYGTKTREFWIYVKEEELPLICQLPKFSFYPLLEKVKDIKNGSKIYCYVKSNGGNFSYSIFELKSEEMIFSLDYYNEQNKSDTLIGLIGMPITAIGVLIGTVFYAKKYKKLKNANS